MALQKRRKELAIKEQLKQETLYVDTETKARETHYLRRGLRVVSVGGMILLYIALVIYFGIVIYK